MQPMTYDEQEGSRICPSCGLSLKTISAPNCPRCGRPLAGGSFPQQGGYGLPAITSEDLPTLPISDLARAVPGSMDQGYYPRPPAARPDFSSGTPLPSPGLSSFPSNPDRSAPPGYLAASAPGGPPPSSSGPTSQKRSSTGLIIGALIILVVILASVLAGALYTLAHSGQPTTTTTPTTTAAPALKVLYQKSFATDANGWAHDSNCALQDHAYHVHGSNICYAPAGAVGDAIISVIVQQVAGPTDAFYGLVFRRVDRNNYYEFEITSKGKWRFAKLVNGVYKDILPSNSDKSINQGLHALNTLQVQMKATHFIFSLNGLEIGSVNDTSFSKGSCGIRTGADGVEAAFNNLLLTTVS